MKIIITESQKSKIFQRLRRISELRESIEFQNEVQDPCNFDDGEEYADFCIDTAFCFFYQDENCRDYDDEDYDEEYENKQENYDDFSERDELYQLLYEEYFFKLKEFWKEYSINCV